MTRSFLDCAPKPHFQLELCLPTKLNSLFILSQLAYKRFFYCLPAFFSCCFQHRLLIWTHLDANWNSASYLQLAYFQKAFFPVFVLSGNRDLYYPEQPYYFRLKVHLVQYLSDHSPWCMCLSFNPTRGITCLLLRQKLGFIESRLQLVVKSAEDMLWYKQALKMMLKGKAKAAIPVSNTPAL